MDRAQRTTPAEHSDSVDVVVVAYRSADTLRGCVEPFAGLPGVNVVVVDNDSPEDEVASLAGLPVEILQTPRNGGFAYGCNLGAARGSAPNLLFLNPDARLAPGALASLQAALEAAPEIGLVGPRILEPPDDIAWSIRRFPRLRSTYAQALFAHRAFPRAAWADELVRDPGAYRRSGRVEWLSGACILIRRDLFAAVGGWDERFFLYCEDTDLCRRVREAGREVHFEADASCFHVGGGSSEVGETQAMLAQSRVLYARKHHSRAYAGAEALGVALGEATHALAAVRRPRSRRGHLRAARAALAR